MNSKSIINLFVTGAIAAGYLAANISQVKADPKVQFICKTSYDQSNDRREPTTFAWHSGGKTALIRWETNYFPGYTPQRRCDEVSPRFQEAYNNGTINLITNGKMNNQPVICTAKEPGGDCDTLLMTLRPEDNSLQILNHVKEIFSGHQIGPVKHSSAIPQIYYQINIDEFLRNAPIEKE